MTKLKILFSNRKQERKSNWLVRDFSRMKAIIFPRNSEEYLELIRKRGFGKQYRSSKGEIFFPTEAGWKSFTQFIDLMHETEPFLSMATRNDVYQSYLTAFANMISDGFLPENHEELSKYLSQEFIDSLGSRGEVVFHKLAGLSVKGDVFLRVGEGWVGRFGGLSFDSISRDNWERHEETIQDLRRVFDQDSPVISGGRIHATRDRVASMNSFRCEVALGILNVMINMTYQNAFSRLWKVRRVERPEHGVERQASFGFVRHSRMGSDQGKSLIFNP